MKSLRAAVCVIAFYAPVGNAVICDDGVSRANSSNLCPGRLFNNGTTSVTETSFASIGENDVQGIGGTRIIYVETDPYPPGCSVANYTHPATTTEQKLAKAQCTRSDLMLSGSGASIHTSETLVYAGAYSKVVSGATAGTTYYIHEQIHGGACDDFPNYTQNCRRIGGVSLVTTTEVTTDAADGGGGEGSEILTGAQRYIKNGGNDLSDGLNDTNAWASLSKCSASLPASTDCNLKSGSTWTNQKLRLEHGGTSSDYTVVRTYQMSGSDHVATPIGGTRAIIKGGELSNTCLTAGTCDYRLASLNANNLTQEYDEYVYVGHTADYSRISNLVIEYVQTYGLRVQGSWPTMGSLHHVIIEDILFEDIGLTPFIAENGVQDLIFRRNTLSLAGTCAMQRQMTGTNISYLCPSGSGFPAGGAVARSTPARALIENNNFFRIAGEGFDCHSGSTYVIMRGNRLAQLQSSGLYPDGCNHVVLENNISVGPRGEDFGYLNGSGAGFGGGLTSTIEDWQGASAPDHTDVHVRNNLMVEAGWGVIHGMFTEQLARNKQLGGYIVGNTSIDAIDSDYYLDPPITNSHVSALYYHNNVGWNEARGGAACVMPNISDVTVTHNHSYVSYTSYTKCNGTNNSTGNPQLSVGTYSSWDAYNYASMPTFANAKPQSGSPANNTGTPLTSTILTYTNYGFAAEQMADVLSGAITLDNWAKVLYYDALNVVRNASTPDKGAVEGP